MNNNVYHQSGMKIPQYQQFQATPNSESYNPPTSVSGINTIVDRVSSMYSSMHPTQTSNVTSMKTNVMFKSYHNSSMGPGRIDYEQPTKEQFETWQSVFKKLNDLQNNSVEVSRIIALLSNKMASLLLDTLEKIHGYTPNPITNGKAILTSKERNILEEMKSKADMKLC